MYLQAEWWIGLTNVTRMAAYRDWPIDFCRGMRDARLGQHCNALTAKKKMVCFRFAL